MARERAAEPAPSGLRLLALPIPVLLLVHAAPTAAQETWTATSTTNAPSARYSHTAVWTGSRMIVWGGTKGGYPEKGMDTGAMYDPATNTWTATSTTNAPSARYAHTAVWTGSKMIVWGGADASGYFSTGGIYDPLTDTWAGMSTRNAPTPRTDHTPVWTGSKMIVWGGYNESGVGAPWLSSGGIYDPATDRWTATSMTNVPAARAAHTAVWTGSNMIVWGGWNALDAAGGIYDPATNTWTATSTANAPTGQFGHAAVWTGSSMIAWGQGNNLTAVGGIYDPATDTWAATSTTNAPSKRRFHTAVWTGPKMIVWGGQGALCANTGGIYDPATDTWAATSTTNAPSARCFHTAVWTGSKMIVWGGQLDNASPVNSGGVYSNPAILPPSPPRTDFFTVTPCRLADTRNPAGPRGGPALHAGATRAFPVTGGVCGIPPTAVAVSVNVTAVGAVANGHLTLFRGDATTAPVASTVNFSAGATRANNALVLLAPSFGTINVTNGSTGSVHFVLDVNGYFQ